MTTADDYYDHQDAVQEGLRHLHNLKLAGGYYAGERLLVQDRGVGAGPGTGDNADFAGADYDEDKDLLQILSQWVGADSLDAAAGVILGYQAADVFQH